MLIIVLLLIMTGCSFNVSLETLTDENTTPGVAIMKNVGFETITHHHLYDNMDRGNHDYYNQVLAIDPDVDVSKVSRGDVVLFNDGDGEKDISRVVALPGERIKITKGQIYINGKKLNAFYGNAHRVGLDKKSYFEKMDNAGNPYDKKGMMEVFERSMKEIKLSDGEFYLIGDDWLRGKMVVINEDEFIGKVIGYTE